MGGQTRRAIGAVVPAILIVIITATTLAACGGGGSEMQGIYQATSWTRNDTACDTDGPSVLETESQTVFYIKQENFLGAKFLNINFCADQAECEMLAADDNTINLGRWSAEEGNDDDGWTSRSFSGFPDMNNLCQGTFLSLSLTGVPGQDARVVIQGFPAGNFPPDSDGFCDADDAAAAAQGSPCTSNEVMNATFIAPLP